MINILKADLYRLSKSKSFYLYWTFIIITYLPTIMSKSSGGVSIGIAITVPDVKLDIEQVARNFTYYFLFLFPIYGLIVCDFGEKTIKNTISSAISRKKYFISKFIITELFVLISFTISNVGFYWMNKLVNGSKYSSSFGEFMKAVGLQICPFMGISAALILVAFVVKKTATFNALTIISPLVYSSIAMVIYQLGSKHFVEKYLLKYEFATQLSGVIALSGTYVRNCTILGIALTIISFVAGYVVFTKSEID